VEARARDGQPRVEVVPAQPDDEAVVHVRLGREPARGLRLPALAERRRRLPGDREGEHVRRLGEARARDDAPRPPQGLGVADAGAQLVADDADPYLTT